MPAPMTTNFACVGKAMKSTLGAWSLLRGRTSLTPELWLDAAAKHSDHKPSRFQTNFCKGTEMAKIGAKGGSTRGLPGLALAAGSENSTPQLHVVSDPVRGSSWITGQLRKAIHDGAYANGEKLPAERQLAEAFGTSRTTVRMALDQLEQERLVTR